MTWSDHEIDYICECGAEFYDYGSISAHVKEHYRNGEAVSYADPPCRHMHREDQGWNETYTDYYYCSCGATKPA